MTGQVDSLRRNHVRWSATESAEDVAVPCGCNAAMVRDAPGRQWGCEPRPFTR
jgi:hypothetical protein